MRAGTGLLLSGVLWGCVSEPPPEELESGEIEPTSQPEHSDADTGESGSADEEPAQACEAGEVTTSSGIRFRCIPAGTFEMGCNPERDIPEDWEMCLNHEFPVHEVTLTRAYWLMESELTQAQFEELLDYQPSHFSSSGLGAACGDDCPVEVVRWHEAAYLANQLSQELSLDSCYTCSGTPSAANQDAVTCEPVTEFLECSGFRLPTEAEWEHAARGGESYAYAGSNDADDVAWYHGNHNFSTRPVCGKTPNAWGLCDMSGNVWEWTNDWLGDYSAEAATDPLGPDTGSSRVRRGGGFGSHTDEIRAAERGANPPDRWESNQGFRLARSAE